MFVHNKGYLHKDIKGNNIVLHGKECRPVLIDFANSRKNAKVRLTKLKLNIKEATERFPHIVPELHRGDQQSTASDVYLFGALVRPILKDGNSKSRT